MTSATHLAQRAAAAGIQTPRTRAASSPRTGSPEEAMDFAAHFSDQEPDPEPRRAVGRDATPPPRESADPLLGADPLRLALAILACEAARDVAGAIGTAIAQPGHRLRAGSRRQGIVRRLSIALRGPDLGEVIAVLRLEGDDLAVTLEAQNEEAWRILAAARSDLEAGLAALGFAIGPHSVSIVLRRSTHPGLDGKTSDEVTNDDGTGTAEPESGLSAGLARASGLYL